MSTTDPLSHKTTTTYNSFNEPLVTVDPMGVTTTDTYDTHGNLIKKVVTADTACRSTCTQTTTYTVCATVTCTTSSVTWHGGEMVETGRPAREQDGLPLRHIRRPDCATYPYTKTDKTELTEYHYNILGQKICQTSVAAYAQQHRLSTRQRQQRGQPGWPGRHRGPTTPTAKSSARPTR